MEVPLFNFQHVDALIKNNLFQVNKQQTVFTWMCLHSELQDFNNIDSEYQHFLLANFGSDPLNSLHLSQFAWGSKIRHKYIYASNSSLYKCMLQTRRMHQTDDTEEKHG